MKSDRWASLEEAVDRKSYLLSWRRSSLIREIGALEETLAAVEAFIQEHASDPFPHRADYSGQ